MSEFETLPATVDATWLTTVLHRSGVGVDNSIVDLGQRSIGTGQVGENVRFDLTWRDAGPDLPGSVVGKFPSPSDMSRTAAVNLGTYVREVGFYRDLQPDVSIRTPHVHHVGWDPATHDFVILMEDISPAEQGDQLTGCTVEQAELVVDELVGLHAPTWGRVDALRGLDWLGFPDQERADLLNMAFQAMFPGFAARFADRLAPEDLELGTIITEHYLALQRRLAEWAAAQGDWCVVHGDYRLDNILFGAGAAAPPITVVDWQTVAVGTGPSDLAYFCGAGLLPAAREEAERSLAERYTERLRAAGVEIDLDAVWDGYVLGSASGYLMAVLASQVVEQTERGDEMFAVMAERHAAQMRHVGLLERL